MKETKEIKKAEMVRWLEPRQLIRTGLETIVSTIFGKHADRRILQTSVNSLPEKQYYDFAKKFGNDDDVWVDYIADVGDGFDSTYAAAYYLTRPELKFNKNLQFDENGEIVTNFGNLLIFGGDEVYPTASPEEYHNRLITPYQTAFPKDSSADPPTVFAIPGNHDWYDSLGSFSRLFCEKIRFAGWKTMQDRSYFAIKLGRGWWLFGTDMQLETSLDKPQVDYFTKVMEQLVAPDDSIILCNAVPYWIGAKLDENDADEDDQKTADNPYRRMEFFEGHILKRRTAVFLAGDLHHYCRHENKESGKHKIIAGGGGAFTHPTHTENIEIIGKEKGRKYQHVKSFPDKEVSSKLYFQNIHLMGRNWFFGIVTAIVYLLTARAFQSNIGNLGLSQIGEALHAVLTDTLLKPFALFWVLLVLLCFIFFTDAKSRIWRFLFGGIHALVQLAAVFFVSWGTAYLVSRGQGLDFNSIPQIIGAALLIFIGGWIFGSIIMGLYLTISISVFKRHSNIAFAALGISDYKNFLRLRIDRDGNLTIYPIGIRRVPHLWNDNNLEESEPRIVPNDPEASLPELIEEPILIRKLKPTAAAKTIEKTQAIEIPLEATEIQKIAVR